MEHLTEIIIACMGCAGTFFASVLSNNKWIYRIEQLEKKVEKHNNVIERTTKLEMQFRSQQDQIKELKETVKEEIANDKD